MRDHVTLVAVQIGADHPEITGRSGAVGLSIVGVGLFLVCYGLLPRIRTSLWRAQALSALGHITDNVPGPRWRGKATWLPLIEFQANGITVLSPAATVPTQDGWPLGDEVEILYDPANPRRFGLKDGKLPIPRSLLVGVAIIAGFFVIVG